MILVRFVVIGGGFTNDDEEELEVEASERADDAEAPAEEGGGR